jgi:hypothetical protein
MTCDRVPAKKVRLSEPGRELQVMLIGKFPHTSTLGHPVAPGSPTPDFTVRAMIITVDAESGLACLIGVQTAESGRPSRSPVGRRCESGSACGRIPNASTCSRSMPIAS